MDNKCKFLYEVQLHGGSSDNVRASGYRIGDGFLTFVADVPGTPQFNLASYPVGRIKGVHSVEPPSRMTQT